MPFNGCTKNTIYKVSFQIISSIINAFDLGPMTCSIKLGHVRRSVLLGKVNSVVTILGSSFNVTSIIVIQSFTGVYLCRLSLHYVLMIS